MASQKQGHAYEFGGPIGAAFLVVILPLLVLGITWLSMTTDWKITLPQEPLPSISDLWNLDALKLVCVWNLLQALFYLSPFGKTALGLPLKDGSRLAYNMNGLPAFLLSCVGLAVCYHKNLLPLTFVYDRFIQLAFASWFFSLVLSIYLFTTAIAKGTGYSQPGNSGNVIYDFFMGRELNPRIGNLDLKVFFEMRPGLIGWIMINFCMAVKQYEKHGSVTTSMLLVCFFEFWYILDALWFEEAILSTMDVIHEGFGFMLAFGDIVWVPFLYSLQARYLVDHPVDLPLWAIAGILILQTAGYIIFRRSNSTKNEFRRDPNSPASKRLETLTTDNGKKLIISGWWGMCRHPNYLGDLMMALAWCLPCGFGSILPYYYIIYFTILLIHREGRDSENCQHKHGKGWDKYCKIVKYRIFPGIY
ncbi:Lamin-B receptor [Trichoplax sp. H2]|nr:Lamin-B receptor [Trichoplax sp. H2]|eukprot:RDD42549.1 Lamin-B receptor [Trichoplax sp. H2]